MCREGAWMELAVQVTHVGSVRGGPHGFWDKYAGTVFYRPEHFKRQGHFRSRLAGVSTAWGEDLSGKGARTSRFFRKFSLLVFYRHYGNGLEHLFMRLVPAPVAGSSPGSGKCDRYAAFCVVGRYFLAEGKEKKGPGRDRE